MIIQLINITQIIIEISANDSITIPIIIPILTIVSLEKLDLQVFCPILDE